MGKMLLISIMAIAIGITGCSALRNAGVNVTQVGKCAIDAVKCVGGELADIPADLLNDAEKAIGEE